MSKANATAAAALINQAAASMAWGAALPAIDAPVIPGSPTPRTSTVMVEDESSYALSGQRWQSSGLAVRLNGSIDMDSLTLRDITLQGNRTLLRAYSTGVVRNLTVERCELSDGSYATGMNQGMVIVSNTKLYDAVLRDLKGVWTQPCTDSGDNPAGICLQGKEANDGGERILIERCSMEGLIADYTDRYKNADCYSIEKTYSKVQMRHCFGRNASDAIYDIKAVDSCLDECHGELAREIYKFWCKNHHGAIYGADPTFAGMMVMGPEADYAGTPLVIEHLSLRSAGGTAVPIRFEGGRKDVIIKSHDLSGWNGSSTLGTRDGASAGSTVTWVEGEPVL